MEKRRVVITGMGTVNPLGHNIAESWQAVRDGVCGIAPITQYDSSAQKVHLAGEVKDWDPTTVIDKREVRHMARYSQFAMASAKEAVADSGLDLEAVDHERCGVIVSSGIGGISTTESEQTRCLQRGFDKASPFYIPSSIANMAAGQIAIAFGFKGMCTCPVTACAGGSNAVGDAFRHIRDGYAEVMLCGGAEACVTPLSIGGFTSMRALHVGDDPARASIPFDAERDGFVMGEGAGILLLEEYEHAMARGAKIYAEVVGYGATCDAFHITAPIDDGSGAAKAMEIAMNEAGIQPSDVTYINAHGTSTHLNDLVETRAVKAAFGDAAKDVVINSTKSMIGHLLGAAGGVEFVTCVKSIQDGFIHQTVGSVESEEECDLNYAIGAPVEKPVEYAMSNSLGFGGHNASLLIKKYEE